MNNAVNTGRQLEVDIAKTLAIVFMVLVHTAEYYYNGESYVYEVIVEFLGSPPGAPVFMMALGIGIVYSHHNSARALFFRGINLFVFSYVFNAVVYALPYLLNGDPEYALTEIMDVDVLQFAGLTFIFMALVKKLNMTAKSLIPTIVVIQIINHFLVGYNVVADNYIIARIQGLFWWTCEDSYFPFFSWIAFPVAGMLFGEKLMQVENKDKFYKGVGLVAGVVSIAMYVIGYFLGIEFGAYGTLYQEEYYAMPLYGNILMIFFCLAWMAICYYLSKILSEDAIGFAEKCSRNITYIYFFQYVLIIWLQVLFVGEDNLFGTLKVFILSIIYFVASYSSAQRLRLYKKRQHHLFDLNKNKL